MIPVAECDTLEQAYIIAGMLHANGIPAVIENGIISSVYPMTLSWAAPTVTVAADAVPLAKRLIEESDRS